MVDVCVAVCAGVSCWCMTRLRTGVCWGGNTSTGQVSGDTHTQNFRAQIQTDTAHKAHTTEKPSNECASTRD
jgi:hypothetical protein